ncbi:hypothetical protein ElyMa_003326200 [Elysia marginata]|uniref:RGS domain-containing protein n=1 Tax=Elysia marginata TaxID=1093978 RepID=A0AAV4JDQ6_9GAST|nr:hypothetical protein ElyMa_003326200 [Elysia marginata]
MRRRQECVGVEGQEPEYQEFIYLWSQFVPAPSFENLPLPEMWGQRKGLRAPRKQAPKHISGDKFREFCEKMVAKYMIRLYSDSCLISRVDRETQAIRHSLAHPYDFARGNIRVYCHQQHGERQNNVFTMLIAKKRKDT